MKVGTWSVVSLHRSSFIHHYQYHFSSLLSLQQHYCWSYSMASTYYVCRQSHNSSGRVRCYQYHLRFMPCNALESMKKCHVQLNKTFDKGESDLLLEVQTLRNFPMEKLHGEVVIVRFDSTLILQAVDFDNLSIKKALYTITYLNNAKAKVILISNWHRSGDSMLLTVESLAERLSSLLQIRVVPANSDFMHSKTKSLEEADIILLDNLTEIREERANCSSFSERLASGAGIFVNDTFSISHKILSSTVGIARFCFSSVAGFHFEEELLHLKKTREITRQPYIVIIGGRNFLKKANALRLLASVCDGIIFVGMMAFQIMHALGKPVPSCYVEYNALEEASKLIELSKQRNILLYYPHDLRCVNDGNAEILETFCSDGISTGWTPTDLGPVALKEIFALLSKSKKVLWIGPVQFGSYTKGTYSTDELALMLEKVSNSGCDVTIVGNAACKAVTQISSFTSYKMFQSASVVWEYLRDRTLPGVAALDKAFPTGLDWGSIFIDPTLPLVVDIGSGNGLFLLKLARSSKQSNYLGLEINTKLVKMCLDILEDSEIKNLFFISTNATYTFRSIVSSYPGALVLVSIQCPNPDFNNEDHRWRMVQRTLVEAIIDLLETNGKIFLQSDIKAVSTRMKEQFMIYSKGKLVVDLGNEEGWIEENPFGIRSDWEQHAVDRGAPMYRMMLKIVDHHGLKQVA